MAAGVTDRPWEVSDLAALLEADERGSPEQSGPFALAPQSSASQREQFKQQNVTEGRNGYEQEQAVQRAARNRDVISDVRHEKPHRIISRPE